MISPASEVRSARPAEPIAAFGRRFKSLWYGQPVRTQILMAFAAVTLIAYLITGFVQVFAARSRSSVEMQGPVRLAESLVREKTRSLNELDMRKLADGLAAKLGHLRHVRIVVLDAKGQPVPIETTLPGRDDENSDPAAAPGWFVKLVQPVAEVREVPVIVDSRRAATVMIHGEPADEIQELWRDFRTMALFWFGTNILVLGALYVLLGRILDPLIALADALKGLEDGNFAVRVPPPKVLELRLIAERFNRLAAALDVANAENTRLCRDLITVQEEERRQIASELHDEVGPCLFGIMANVSSIERQAAAVPHDSSQEIVSRVDEIRSIGDRLKAINRTLLKKLRPVALGRIRLTELVGELIGEFENRHPDVRFRLLARDLEQSYGEPVDLNIYRCIQEGVTNALRHGKPSSIMVELSRVPVAGREGEGPTNHITLVMRDDGEGIRLGTPMGFGLATMRERVKGVGGMFSVGRNWPSGTVINISIPIVVHGSAAASETALYGTQA